MYWQEESTEEDVTVPDDIIDLQFAVLGKRIPVDHGFALGRAVTAALPEASRDMPLGVHVIHVAGSQNGWERPAHGPDQFLMLSRRTKLTIRVPKARADELEDSLFGRTLDVAGCELVIGRAKHRSLSKETTLFSRYVLGSGAATEADFLQRAADQLRDIGIHPRKMLCGKAMQIWTPDGAGQARSLLVAQLGIEEAILLQRCGLGPGREMGCGLFIPHKGIDAVTDRAK